MMEYALIEGYVFITFVSTIYMLEHGVSVGWHITPLGAPAMIDGKPTIAAWIEAHAVPVAAVKASIERSERSAGTWTLAKLLVAVSSMLNL